MRDYRVIINKNRSKLYELTNCKKRLIDKCIESTILTEDDGEEILSILSKYERSRKFYEYLLVKDQTRFEKLFEIFKEDSTRQSDEVIEILSNVFLSNDTQSAVSADITTYILQGSNIQMETFKPDISYLTFSTIQLNQVTTDGSSLIRSLSSCVNLERLTLEQVLLTGNFKDERAFLPKLQKFVIDLIQILDVTLVLSSQNSSYIDKEGFKSIIFFNKSQRKWKSEDVLDLGVDIDFSVGGTKNFSVNHAEGYVSSRLEISEDILLNLKDFKLKKLALQVCEINISVICLPHLTYVNFNNVYVVPNLAVFFRNCENLKFISIWNCPQKIVLNLMDIPRSMTHLTIAQVGIEYSPAVAFNKLELLYLDRCEMDEQVLQNFSSIFNSKNVSINPYQHSSLQMHPLLKNILDNRRTTWIRFWMLRYFEAGYEPQYFKEMEDFLLDLNLGKRDKRFVLKWGDRGWRKEKLNVFGREQYYFLLFRGDDFWNSFGHFYKNKCI